MNVHFVDVEAEFDKDGGHQAYSNDAWINKIILTKQDQDLEQNGIGSSYSIHPNEEGAKAYARCVNAKIKEIENSKITRSSAMLLKAQDTAVTEAVEDVTDEILTTAAVTDTVIDTAETTAAEAELIETTTAVTNDSASETIE